MSWVGYRKFKVYSKIPEAENVCSFYLSPLDGKPLPPYLPGQYLTFQFHMPGEEKPVIRCYSLSDSPNHPDHYRITVKKILPPPNRPNDPMGRVSSFLVDAVFENDVLEVKAPAGVFCLHPKGKSPVVLLAGGIGITPLLCMLNTLIESGSQRDIWFFLGVRNRKEHVMKEHLEQVAREHKNVHLNVCYSRPSDDDIKGQDYQFAGHVNVDLLKQVLPLQNYNFYLCGPESMMAALRTGLKEWGVPENRIWYEKFGSGPPALEKPPPDISPGKSKAIQITFKNSNKTILWDGSDSILEFAEANGIALDFGCRSGNCGTCSVKVLSGEVEYQDIPSADIEEDHCLACSAVPKTDLVLDA
ncbi:MAG: oxidoreductase FAD/NAD(P)-binding domain-containing protein [Nitrospinaceae bacterium]|nr:MAG: oxidoreductase FAD/NAD(P)-binding domain-containing protein [Nitrospinaceae bacterium]